MVAPAESSTPEGSEVLRALLDPEDPIWQKAILDYDDDHSGPTIRSFKRDRILTGTTESGAHLKAVNENFLREEQREVFSGLGTPHISSSLEWQTVQHSKGLRLTLERSPEKDKRKITMFLPDSLPPEGTFQYPLEIKVEDTSGVKMLKPEDDGFKETEDEIKFYLGDNVAWDERESKDV